MSRVHVLASERNYISKEPIATCIPIEDAQTLNGTLIGGKRVAVCLSGERLQLVFLRRGGS